MRRLTWQVLSDPVSSADASADAAVEGGVGERNVWRPPVSPLGGVSARMRQSSAQTCLVQGWDRVPVDTLPVASPTEIEQVKELAPATEINVQKKEPFSCFMPWPFACGKKLCPPLLSPLSLHPGSPERGDVLAAGGLPPAGDGDAGPLALPGVGGQHLTVAGVAGTLAHVQLAGVVVVAGVHVLLAHVKEGGVEGVAVAVRPDLGLPGL